MRRLRDMMPNQSVTTLKQVIHTAAGVKPRFSKDGEVGGDKSMCKCFQLVLQLREKKWRFLQRTDKEETFQSLLKR